MHQSGSDRRNVRQDEEDPDEHTVRSGCRGPKVLDPKVAARVAGQMKGQHSQRDGFESRGEQS